ncbi:MAG: glycoside hydrolase family 16 protein [Chloroflexi bacterium]|nr:glycoside hydrolase family 16 protein [Chloroflexota bacterium]MCL5274501.1 glycoside hydrolase family 16 protein [Chloroflexota bacterium]
MIENFESDKKSRRHTSVNVRRRSVAILAVALLAALAVYTLFGSAHAQAVQMAPAGWNLVWQDEFNAPDGSSPDSTKWVFDQGGGWGNGAELQYYTNRLANASIQNGALQITAIRENYGNRAYTSARLKTHGTFAQQYGWFEARIKIPAGKGVWPAFWLLGDNIDQAGWPACGEIDVMEHINFEPSVVSTLHLPGAFGNVQIGADYISPYTSDFSAGYHVYAVEWEPEAIRFYVDDALAHVVTRASLRPGDQWVFDHPFYMVLNVAVGGNWPGYPDATTVFPQTMSVDYVRVFSR